MKQHTLFLKLILLLMGLFVLIICIFALFPALGEPEADQYRLIVFGIYATTIPFFIALYQTFKLLRYIDQSKAFSNLSVKALQYIKCCAASVGVIYTAGLPLLHARAQQEDAPGVLALGLIVVFASLAIAVFAAVLQKLLQQAIAVKNEHDLTV